MKISDIVFTLPDDTRKPSAAHGIEKKPRTNGMFQSVTDRFLQICRHHPDRLALSDENGNLSFSQLDQLSAKIAVFLKKQGIEHEGTVGVMCGRSVLFVAAFLGIIRAGGVYVPLDPVLPLNRRKTMVLDSRAAFLITDKTHAGDARKLAYACPGLRALLCLDVPRFEDAVERPGELMSIELWHHVSQTVPDGSWKSLFTGSLLSSDALDSLSGNLLNKVGFRLGPDSRVLDIGSGAGRVAQALMANCKEYICVDLSRFELDRAEEAAANVSGLTIHVHQMEALDIHLLNLENQDLVVINSVMENFPGYNYLGSVLDQAMAALKNDGVLFAGSVWDPEKKASLLSDLEAYGERTGDFSGLMRLVQGDELFVPKIFFKEWVFTSRWEVSLEFSNPETDDPELSRYRYDVILRKKGTKPAPELPVRYFGTKQFTAKNPVDVPASPAKNASDTALYMIFTSGTTGRPKGVMVAQNSFLNLYTALEEQVYTRKHHLELALLASFSFDASLQQVAATLLGGHTLHIIPEAVKTDPKALYRYLEDHRIDICDGTPSLFSLLMDFCLENEKACTVDTFILGGEPLKSDVLSRYFSMENHGHGRIINAYGPTECTVDATLFTITQTNHDAYGTPPIGYALPNTCITVRGKGGDILPPGMAGELWISGRGLAREYFNDPILTAERFPVLEGERCYKTGDMGRQLKDGLLFLSGREDDQVKVGGFRVELGEVKAALDSCPMIKNAVVRAGDFSGSGVNTLACYYIPKNGSDISIIRRFLGNLLPKYAIPSHYVPMTDFPISSSGKIDFHSLPSPLGNAKTDAGTPEQPLSTPTQQKIARLWESLLGRPVSSTNCDFFEMGGHSILGVRLITQMEKTFGRRLSLFDLYRASTIASQADLLDKKDGGQGTFQPIVTFSDSGKRPAVFLFHPVGGHALRYRFLADLLAKNFRVFGVQAPGVDQETSHLPDVGQMARQYLSWILDKVPRAPLIFAGWSFGGLVAFEAACCLEKKENRTAPVILLDTVADNRFARQIVAEDESAMLERLFRENLGVTRDQLGHLKGRKRLNHLIDLGVENGLLPSGFTQNQMRRLLQIYNGNALAAARYQPEKFRGHGLLIRPSQAIDSAMTIPDDPMQGWHGYFEKGITLKWVRGNHETLLTKTGATDVWHHMTAYLKKDLL